MDFKHPGLIPAAILCLCLSSFVHAQGPTVNKIDDAPASTTSIPSIAPKDRLSESWWANRHKSIVAALPDHADAELVFLGDSITQNYEKSSPANENFQPIWQQYYAPRKALNLGFSGDTTANVLWRLDHGEVAGLSPKVVVLLIGTNDTAHGLTAEQTEAGIDAVIVSLEYHLPKAKILLLGILPTGLQSHSADLDINSYLATRYAGGHDPQVSFTDIGVIFYEGGTLADGFFYDPFLKPPQPALHPNALGQRRMASAIEGPLARLLGEAPIPPAN
jgi:lysophospholipase L1-like esterase